MKVSIAVIKLVLRTNKTLADGSHPIMLRVSFNCMKERVVMYTARHSFACHYLNSEGSTIAGLATLMARSPNTIAQYVHQLTNDEEIASMVESMVI